MADTITVPLCSIKGLFLCEVEAEIVDVAPHLATHATFAVHQNPWGSSWQITNVESGRRCGDFYGSRADAIKHSTKYLKDKTVERLNNGYRKCGLRP